MKDENQWLQRFFERSDITYITPGKNQQKYQGKVSAEKRFVQICYLLRNFNMFEILNGTTLSRSDESFRKRFSKDITFRQLY